MRKGQRFTPARLERWRQAGRGTGTGAGYQPWHQVTRDDPGSRGRSHLLNWRFDRLHHLLSDLELVAFGFATMLPRILDLREQFPLSLEEHLPEAAAYRLDAIVRVPGTRDIACRLRSKHPLSRGDGTTCPWVMSTDLVLTLGVSSKEAVVLAVGVKFDEELARRRTRELLEIEREYWQLQGVTWLLITPSLYSRDAATAVRIGMPWSIGQPPVGVDLLMKCRELASYLQRRSLKDGLDIIGRVLSVDRCMAQAVLWQAIWCGAVPAKLDPLARQGGVIELLPEDSFWQQNPIASRRSVWTI